MLPFRLERTNLPTHRRPPDEELKAMLQAEKVARLGVETERTEAQVKVDAILNHATAAPNGDARDANHGTVGGGDYSNCGGGAGHDGGGGSVNGDRNSDGGGGGGGGGGGSGEGGGGGDGGDSGDDSSDEAHEHDNVGDPTLPDADGGAGSDGGNGVLEREDADPATAELRRSTRTRVDEAEVQARRVIGECPTVADLKRWLNSRSLRAVGNKGDLQEAVRSHFVCDIVDTHVVDGAVELARSASATTIAAARQTRMGAFVDASADEAEAEPQLADKGMEAQCRYAVDHINGNVNKASRERTTNGQGGRQRFMGESFVGETTGPAAAAQAETETEAQAQALMEEESRAAASVPEPTDLIGDYNLIRVSSLVF